MNESKIKSMKLYKNADRIFNELKELDKDKLKKLKVKDLTKFDQLHYNGTKAVDFAIKKIGINSKKRILEIGSGIGGPSRYISYKTKSLVTALEIQKDQNKIAKILTKKCGLTKYVKHEEGDILVYNSARKKYNAIVSWLTLYHIRNHKKLLKKCNDLISKNGYFFAEDIIAQKRLNKKDLSTLSKELYANYLPTYDNYLKDLENAGFEIIYHKNMSKNWANFVNKRKKLYNKNKNRNLKIHGNEIFENVFNFYSVVDKFFASKKIGGIIVIAKKL